MRSPSQKKTIGILGVGQLTEFILEGINKKKNEYDFILSPRSKNRSIKLSKDFHYKIARSNQEVLDNCQMILICLPSKTSPDILSKLKFSDDHIVMSTMASITKTKLQKILKKPKICVSMMPGYANANLNGPIAMYPFEKNWNNFFNSIGSVIIFNTEKEFNIAATFGAISGVSFMFFQLLIDWYISKGLDYKTAQLLVLKTFSGNADALNEKGDDLDTIIKSVSTKGGITEKLTSELKASGAFEAWPAALDALLRLNE